MPKKARIVCSAAAAFLLTALAAAPYAIAQQSADERAIEALIGRYAQMVDRADLKMADDLFSDAPEVTFIDPLGEDHGRARIESDLIQNLMGTTFSERQLTPKDISVHVYGDTAWSEFQWDFIAKVRKDGSPLHSQGVETQIYRREQGRWRIVHVHYSGAVVSGNLKGY